MSESLRIDTTELISGALVIGDTGHGVLGSAVPSTGEDGPSFLYDDLSLPADSGKEIRGHITTFPVGGTFFAWEDGRFSFDAPDGDYTFVYQLYVDGVAVGSPVTEYITIGLPPSGTVSGSATLGNFSASGNLYDPLALIYKILTNRQELNPTTSTFTIYDDDGTTVLLSAQAWADAGGTIPYSGSTLARIDRLV